MAGRGEGGRGNSSLREDCCGRCKGKPCSSAPHCLDCLQTAPDVEPFVTAQWMPSQPGNPAGTCHHLWLDWASESFSALRLWTTCFQSQRTTRVDSVLLPDFKCFDYKSETPLPIPCRAPLSPSLSLPSPLHTVAFCMSQALIPRCWVV